MSSSETSKAVSKELAGLSLPASISLNVVRDVRVSDEDRLDEKDLHLRMDGKASRWHSLDLSEALVSLSAYCAYIL
jgi:hypothetical protein